MTRNMDVFIGCVSEYWCADAVIFGAPFDSTTSYRPGARFGSSAIRRESFGIETYSPYQNADLADFQVFDSGDMELCFGNSVLALTDIEARAREILNDNKLPVLLGGEHLVSLGAINAAFKKYPNLHIIQFDAHADLRDDYLGAIFSHASVIRRAWELVGDGRIHQFCIRSGERGEFEFADRHTNLHKFNFDGLTETVAGLSQNDTPVYLTIDLDCLDPSQLSGTGTPEAGGVTFTELLKAIIEVSRLNIVGCDIVELAPNIDSSGASTALACKLTRELIMATLKPRLERREAERLKREAEEREAEEREAEKAALSAVKPRDDGTAGENQLLPSDTGDNVPCRVTDGDEDNILKEEDNTIE